MTTPTLRQTVRRVLPRTAFGMGIALIIAVAIVGTALFNKNRLLTSMRSGDGLKANFASGSTLVPYLSQVKVAFVPVGIVTGVTRQSDGTAMVSVKVDKGVREKLGSAPSAIIRPTTLLGGNYFVDLVPGGDRVPFSGTIPLARTHMPVELDKVAAALQPNALKGLQTTASKLDAAFTGGAGSALDQLAADAPATLSDATTVLTAAQGTQRYTDLTRLVQGLETTGRVLTTNQGQLDDIVTNLTTTASVLSARAGDLSATLAQLPSTLRSAQAGLDVLDTTLTKLRETAEPAGPSVDRLSTLLTHANPVLVAAVPVVGQLNQTLIDLEPTVRGLVPVSRGATTILDSVRGPVLDRINGPVRTTILSPYKGVGQYASSSSDKPLYQELAYMLADVDRASSLADHNGNAIGFLPGVGAGSVGGIPISLEQMYQVLTASIMTSGNGAR